MAVQEQKQPQLNISSDGMEAYLRLPVPSLGEPYTEDKILQFLSEKGVCVGIQKEAIKGLLDAGIYERDVRVAVGTKPVDGTDGYYEYEFNSDFSKKPKIREDGTVDYWSMNLIEVVREGQEIAKYHPAVEAKAGVDVKGRPVTGKHGRELPPLKGKGFERSEDNLTYIAVISGKITKQEDRITILPIYEISGDVDISIGNIDFVGDVVIHGNVCNGVVIKSTGNITIDGVVESAHIYAQKDVILRSGMLGGSKSTIYAKGNLFAKFVEYTEVEVCGNIEADVFMDCEVTCKGYLVMKGKRAKIMGGHIYAAYGIDANDIGNVAEVSTYVAVGVGNKEDAKLAALQKQLKENQDTLDKMERALKQFDLAEKEKGVSYKNDPRRMQLLRERIKYIATINADKATAWELQQLIENAKHATVKANHNVYPGVLVKIGDLVTNVKVQQGNLEFVKRVDHIVMSPLDEKVVI